jgi:multidrug efflux pump subunit AcrB
MSALESLAKDVLPKDMGYEWNALATNRKKRRQNLAPPLCSVFLLFVLFLILAAQYENWASPLASYRARQSQFSVLFWLCG